MLSRCLKGESDVAGACLHTPSLFKYDASYATQASIEGEANRVSNKEPGSHKASENRLGQIFHVTGSVDFDTVTSSLNIHM